MTVGNFDGVHLGHCKILAAVKLQAERLSVPSTVVIFEPQPREYSLDVPPPRLTGLREKVRLILAQGIDHVLCMRFDEDLKHLRAESFIEQVLVDAIGARCVVVGDDFRFGSGREGDYHLLETCSVDYGFSLEPVATISDGQERISSTRIREALGRDDFDLASKLLGRPYTLTGRVARGQQLGRQLGFPTANMVVGQHQLPLNGVFAVRLQLPDGQSSQGIANIGKRPTIGDLEKPILEVHILDYEGDIYGRRITVEPVCKLREEKTFESLDQLKAAIKKDYDTARKFFAS